MRIVRRIAIVLACAVAPLAHATSWSSDISDLWWAPAESGWGLQIVQTYDQAFVTIYVYRPDRAPTWYSGLISGPIANMTGTLTETSGPWFGGPFTGGVGQRPVGTFTFNSIDTFEAKITYSVDGVTVTKTVERQPAGREDNAGQFRGGANVTRETGTCATFATGRGQAGELEIVQPNRGSAMRGTLRIGSGSCVMANGDYIQNGRFGDVYGAASCSNGDGGTLYLYEMRANFNSLTAKFEYENKAAGCKLKGDFAGTRL